MAMVMIKMTSMRGHPSQAIKPILQHSLSLADWGAEVKIIMIMVEL